MKYLHTMVRVENVDASMRFYCDALGLREVKRSESAAGRFTLIYLAAPGDEDAQVELTYNWPDADGKAEAYTGGRNFGHLAYAVDDIYALCQRDGSDFNLAYIPSDFTDEPIEAFEPAYMRKLFDVGYRIGATDNPWQHEPPGFNGGSRTIGTENAPRFAPTGSTAEQLDGR